MYRSALTDQLIQQVLQVDRGNEAALQSWSLKDFTGEGDNYSTYVTGINVSYTKGGTPLETSYVAKINPCQNLSEAGGLTAAMFEKEGQFYSKLVPALSSELASVGEVGLRVPKGFHVSLDRGCEMIIMEDLRPRGFKMNDRVKGLDASHALLAVQELARLHAASMLLRIHKGPKLMEEILAKDWMRFDEATHDFLKVKYSGHVDNAIVTLEKVGGYDKTVAWLRKIKPRALEILEEQTKPSKQFDVVSHGDCWNNNLLFRYNSEEHPVEVMLVDLQLVRRASLAIDLNFLLYTSMDGPTRKENMGKFLDAYYESFQTILETAKVEMPFSRTELRREFIAKHLYGFLFAIFIIPLSVCGTDQLPKGLTDSFGKRQENLMLGMLDTNPFFRPRFLALFDEMTEDGIIDSE